MSFIDWLFGFAFIACGVVMIAVTFGLLPHQLFPTTLFVVALLYLLNARRARQTYVER